MKQTVDGWSVDLPQGYSGRMVLFTSPNPPGSSVPTCTFHVMVEDVPEGLTAEKFKEAQLKSQGPKSRLSITKVSVGKAGDLSGPMLECSSVNPSGIPLATMMLFLVKGKRGYVLSASTGPSLDHRRKEFETLFASFKIG
ncbi:MAG: hypothetical protein IPJ65_24105 [Archangiaceae bacterium]|nr:hypothetical protein [Archangiaceae bacterium]